MFVTIVFMSEWSWCTIGVCSVHFGQIKPAVAVHKQFSATQPFNPLLDEVNNALCEAKKIKLLFSASKNFGNARYPSPLPSGDGV